MSAKAKLPRGLQVKKQPKAKRLWADPSTPETYDTWYYQIMITDDAGQRHRVYRNTQRTDYAQAVEFARLKFQEFQLMQTQELRQALAVRREGIKLGAFLDTFSQVAESRALHEGGAAVPRRLRHILAIANGWLLPYSPTRIDRNGGELVHRCNALNLYQALTDSTAVEYARRMQVMAEVREELDVDDDEDLDDDEVATLFEQRLTSARLNLSKVNPPLVNGTIMSTLTSARQVLSRSSRVLELAKLPLDWAQLERFRSLSLPIAERDIGAELPTEQQWSSLMAECATMAQGTEEERELALVNELLRLLALRSRELVMARESWLRQGSGDRWFLELKDRPAERFGCKGRKKALLPLSADLARRLLARCAAARAAGLDNPFLILPMVPGAEIVGREQSARSALIRGRHNAFIKRHIGEVRSHQGNHRLRKYCATAIYGREIREHGDERRATGAVIDYLRQEKEATALCSYIAKHPERLRLVTDEVLNSARATV
jgi:hypothetical protein